MPYPQPAVQTNNVVEEPLVTLYAKSRFLQLRHTGLHYGNDKAGSPLRPWMGDQNL